MNAKHRRKLEMGRRAFDFSRSHPDSSQGYTAAVARLEELLEKGEQLAARKRDGVLTVGAGTARKRDLRRSMKQGQLAHLASVAKVASREVPELAQKFVFKPGVRTYLAFETAARGMAAEAQAHREVLVKHGLVESVLDSLVTALEQFDAAVQQSAQGRQAHVGAGAELGQVVNEIGKIVHVLDGLNRYRFEHDAESLAAWESASNVLATPRSKPTSGDTPPTGGEIRPAA